MSSNITKLKTNNKNEEVILAYLESNASNVLAEKINAGDKTLTQCWNYIVSEARKQAQNGCACIADSEVYGWAIHFFEEDSIHGADFNNKKAKVKAVTPNTKPCEPYEEQPEKTDVDVSTPKKPKKAPVIDTAQLSFDDMFG